MESPALRVSADGLRLEAGWCESLAETLLGNTAPSAMGSSWLVSTASANASNGGVAAATIRCTFRVQATATKFAAAATGYVENEASSAARFPAIRKPMLMVNRQYDP